MLWIEDFTIAIIEKNPMHLDKLINEMPYFEDIDEARTAHALIQEALQYMKAEQQNVYDAMEKLKKAKAFITSAHSVDSPQHEYRG